MIRTRTTLMALLLTAAVLFTVSCREQPDYVAVSHSDITQVKQAEWTKNLNIYEVNVRQFTPEGTFTAMEEHLPRLKELGTDILWFMPVYPIGELNRKGTLGSYYSIKDFKAVNPEFGTDEDFKNLVKSAHELGMYVILDWVGNHSSWDNPLVTEKPEFYKKDSLGNMVSPFDWTDVVAFDYSNPEVNEYMFDAMKYWVSEFDIDGYRCDVAEMVPMTFWDMARAGLDKMKPVFMLAEGEKPWLHSAFDMSYGWEFHNIKNKIARGEADAGDIEAYLKRNDSLYPAGAYRMYFITNHDENSWNGTEFERLGEGVEAFYVLSATVPGMPLVYSGQEAGLGKRLEFFEKDPIDWNNYPMKDFYSTLLQFRKNTPALYNGPWGGTWERITTSAGDRVFAFMREKDRSRVLVILNLSGEAADITLSGNRYTGNYTKLFEGSKQQIKRNHSESLPAWGYSVYYR